MRPEFPVEGGCVCGSVRYRLNALPKAVYACHCKDCQRMSNTTHTISMVVPEAEVAHVSGELSVYEKTADSGRVVKMFACARCGTKMWNQPPAGEILIMKAGNLDEIGWAAPVGNIWTASRAPWVELDPDVPNFDGQPADRQALIDAFAAKWGVAS